MDEFRTQSKRRSSPEEKERIEINPQELLDHFRVLYRRDKEMMGKLKVCLVQNYIEIGPIMKN